jgi:hypothetical protein
MIGSVIAMEPRDYVCSGIRCFQRNVAEHRTLLPVVSTHLFVSPKHPNFTAIGEFVSSLLEPARFTSAATPRMRKEHSGEQGPKLERGGLPFPQCIRHPLSYFVETPLLN